MTDGCEKEGGRAKVVVKKKRRRKARKGRKGIVVQC